MNRKVQLWLYGADVTYAMVKIPKLKAQEAVYESLNEPSNISWVQIGRSLGIEGNSWIIKGIIGLLDHIKVLLIISLILEALIERRFICRLVRVAFSGGIDDPTLIIFVGLIAPLNVVGVQRLIVLYEVGLVRKRLILIV